MSFLAFKQKQQQLFLQSVNGCKFSMLTSVSDHRQITLGLVLTLCSMKLLSAEEWPELLHFALPLRGILVSFYTEGIYYDTGLLVNDVQKVREECGTAMLADTMTTCTVMPA